MNFPISHNSFRNRPVIVLATLLWVITSVSLLSKNVRVVVNASADEDYLEETAKKKFQTYHFFEGKFFSGTKRDNRLRGLDFKEVAKTTAKYLAEQNFIPEKDVKKGDLLIMITWGTTSLDPDYIELMGVTDLGGGMNTVPDVSGDGTQNGMEGVEGAPAPVDIESIAFYSNSAGGFHAQRNFKMLGYSKGLNSKKLSNAKKESLRHDLEEERYFIVLNAFDLPYLRETGNYKELWSSRISTRNIGTNFVAALETMNIAATPTFGKNLDQLKTDRIDIDANVQVGEIEVIGTEDVETNPQKIQ